MTADLAPFVAGIAAVWLIGTILIVTVAHIRRGRR